MSKAFSIEKPEEDKSQARLKVGGREFVLRPLFEEAAITWCELQVECGRIKAAAMGAQDIDREQLALVIMAGDHMVSMALGDDEIASRLREDEKRLVIETQDRLQQSGLIEPFLAIQQTAARAYLGMPGIEVGAE